MKFLGKTKQLPFSKSTRVRLSWNLINIWWLVLGIWNFLFASYAPEDSNNQYLLDKQLANYFPAWEVCFDSAKGGLRTSQGCLDLLNWYIDLEARYEVYLSQILGLRYRNHFRGDYGEQLSNHYFQPFFQLKEDVRLLLTITTHYYKGEDEIGIGSYFGRDYLNYLETFIIVENFDRNFSLQHMPEGPDKLIYKDLRYPVKWLAILNKNSAKGHINLKSELSLPYRLESTDEPCSYAEEGFQRFFYTRFWYDVGRWRIGGIGNFKNSKISKTYPELVFDKTISDLIAESMIGYRWTEKWRPVLYLTYNLKTEEDTLYYRRDVYAYLLSVEFQPGGNFRWHFGTQRQYYNNNRGRNFKERRFTLGLEYRYKNVWFYLVEAMEGDFPTPKYLHNHTYVQLMLRF